jgi:hypothetical protein
MQNEEENDRKRELNEGRAELKKPVAARGQPGNLPSEGKGVRTISG